MPAPPELLNLVERFHDNIDSYKRDEYKEAHVREEFINPMMELLGWDMSNKRGWAEAYKEVVHEASLQVEGVPKAPDYAFRIGGTKKFYLEAKKPRVNLKLDVGPSYQLRRYAWTAKLPLSILTDFEEWAVYDCRIKPERTDKASKARIKYLKYTQYPEAWDEIAGVFSRDAILRGAFDRYAAEAKTKRGTAEVDDAFLKEIEGWREVLAQEIARRNRELSQREVNFAVQRTIDRIVFLRICEARSIEPYRQLSETTKGKGVYGHLCDLFRHADNKYNSGLFHFYEEKARADAPDRLTLDLRIDDKALRDIITGLYFPHSPYEFSVLPADILGQVYERFLGKVIILDSHHRASIEEKPEVRKAGGVYYTPTYVVDYIVEQTVGKLVEGKSAKQAEKVTVLDPACGSGSFLLGAYQYLLDWHRNWYVENGAEKWAKGRNPKLYVSAQGEWRLTTAERKRILLNNIYGVDVDLQAVEVTKLSLLLKVLEGETEQTLSSQLKLFAERALPTLDGNIKSGNSLIGSDLYARVQLDILEDDEQYRVNPFDWEAEFPDIVQAGGFDAVIGNPPYIPIETMAAYERAYYQDHFRELDRKYDSSVIFTLAMLRHLKPGGLLGFISSVTWQTGENYGKVRETLFTKHGVVKIVNLPFDVFKDAYVDTGIFVLSGKQTESYDIYTFPKKERSPDLGGVHWTTVPVSLIAAPDHKVVLNPTAQEILERATADEGFTTLGEFTNSTQGLSPSRFELHDVRAEQGWYPYLAKGQVYRYQLDVEEVAFTDMDVHASLKKFYGDDPKLLIRRVINREDRLMATYFDRAMVFKKDINPFVFADSAWEPLFVLGILNSKLISYLYMNTSAIATKDDFRQTTLAELRRLPIPKYSGSNPDHQALIGLVEQLLAFPGRLAGARMAHDTILIQRQVDSAERKVDSLVYQMYGLTPDEIGRIATGENDG